MAKTSRKDKSKINSKVPIKTLAHRPPLIAERIYNRGEAAQACGVAYITVVRACAAGKLAYYKQGRRILHSGQHLLAWLKQQEVLAKEVKTDA